jgi:hypothetical protein
MPTGTKRSSSSSSSGTQATSLSLSTQNKRHKMNTDSRRGFFQRKPP